MPLLALKFTFAFKARDGYPRFVFQLWTSSDGFEWKQEPDQEMDYGLTDRTDEELVTLGHRLLAMDQAGLSRLEWATVEGLRYALREELELRTFD